MNLRPQRKNANKHSEHGERLLRKSLQQDGWEGAQTVAADGEMISGSLRLEIAADMFPNVEPIIVESDGTRPVIVKRTDIPNADDPRARRLSVAANQIAVTDWNPDGDLLKEWGNEDKDIRAMFADSEWEEVTGEKKPSKDAEPQIDRAAELLEKWGVRTGDLWQIGEHRLICGDCTDAAVVARVMGGEKAQLVHIDPPFGNDLGYGRGLLGERRIVGDEDTDTLDKLPSICLDNLEKDNHCLVWVQWRTYSHLERIYLDAGFGLRTVVVWDKKQAGLSGGGFAEQHEWMCVFTFGEARQNEYSGNLWSESRETGFDGRIIHPHMKPVEVVQKAIDLCSKGDNIVFDGCCGSGTTLVACQNLGRRGRAVEISPAYCAVTLERMFTAFPGIEIKRIE